MRRQAFPSLIGLAYVVLGVSDLAAILVSVLAGTLTIPASAWLARRTFGAGAGAAAASLLALSGFHVAFSRMALTDVSFLLCWVLGLICGQRYLERPGLGTAVTLGLSVGLAQWFKYNGWLIGVLVIITALVGLIVDARERGRSRLLRIWGFGLIAALVAAAIYWPWFGFVERHGGYARLLDHQRSYLGGVRSWLPHLRVQLQQMSALSGGPIWNAGGILLAFACGLLLVPPERRPRLGRVADRLATIGLLVVVFPHYVWWLVGPWILGRARWANSSSRLLAAAWLGLSLLTPFYHPYARLWLPLFHLGLIVMADLISAPFRMTQASGEILPNAPAHGTRSFLLAIPWVPLVWAMAVLFLLGPDFTRSPTLGPGTLPGPLAPSDSLRTATRQVLADLPKETPGLRLLARPPVRFYLAGRVPMRIEPDLARLLEPANPGLWALVDLTQLRQDGDLIDAQAKILSHWELVREYPTMLNLPTLLDFDPGAARAGSSDALQAPLWLLRPRSGGTRR